MSGSTIWLCGYTPPASEPSRLAPHPAIDTPFEPSHPNKPVNYRIVLPRTALPRKNRRLRAKACEGREWW